MNKFVGGAGPGAPRGWVKKFSGVRGQEAAPGGTGDAPAAPARDIPISPAGVDFGCMLPFSALRRRPPPADLRPLPSAGRSKICPRSSELSCLDIENSDFRIRKNNCLLMI